MRLNHQARARFELQLAYVDTQLMLEAERHNQMAWLVAQSCATRMNKEGTNKLQTELQKQIDRATQLGAFDLSSLLKTKTTGRSIDELARIYTMLEDKLDAVVASAAKPA